MKSNKSDNTKKPQIDKKLEIANEDFNKMMAQIEPFIKKSSIVINTTEGKWFDTNISFEKSIPTTSVFNF